MKLFVADFDDLTAVRAMSPVSVAAVIVVSDFRLVMADFGEFGIAVGASREDECKRSGHCQFKASSKQHRNFSYG
jgi:hypothetical protein